MLIENKIDILCEYEVFICILIHLFLKFIILKLIILQKIQFIIRVNKYKILIASLIHKWKSMKM